MTDTVRAVLIRRASLVVPSESAFMEELKMHSRWIRRGALVVALGLGSFLFQSCPFGGLVDDCFGSNTISESEYDDLNAVERLAYEENECGRYTERSDWIGDLFGP